MRDQPQEVGFAIENGNAYVSVYENVAKQARNVYLNFSRSTVDPSSYVCEQQTYCWDPANPSACETYEWCHYTRSSWEYGWGEIAKKDLKVSGAGLELRTNLANATNFYSETCTWDETTWTGSCQTGTAKGSFALKWAKNGESSSSSNGTSQYTYGKYSYKSTGQWGSASADVTGSAFGLAVETTGDISRSHTNSIVKDIVPSTKP